MNHRPSLTLPSQFIYEIPYTDLSFGPILGSGSYGQVFSGTWRNRKVAIKVYQNRREKESFKNELDRLSQINHTNIVKLYGSSDEPSIRGNLTKCHLIMELSEYGSLGNLLHEKREQHYDLRHACSWAHQAAQGVAYLHSLKPKPLIHRDLKPDNLLLFEAGKTLKICDFGTAALQKTNMTNNTGSAYYMAPEVFRTNNYDQRCDVYSWSIIFWEILARKVPYSDIKQDLTAMILCYNTSERKLRPNKLQDCPRTIWKLIESSWDDDPSKRPPMHVVVEKMRQIDYIAKYKPDNQRGSQRNSSTRSNRSSRSGGDNNNMNHEDLANQFMESMKIVKALNQLKATKYRLRKVKNWCEAREQLDNIDPKQRPKLMSEIDEIEHLERYIDSLRKQQNQIQIK